MRLSAPLATLLVCLLGPSYATAVQAPAATPARGTGEALDPAALDRSLELGRMYLLNAQRPDGSFIYERHAERGNDLGTRHATREIGGLWGLALFHRQEPAAETATAILKALDHYGRQVKRTAAGALYLCESRGVEGSTNLMALYVLSLQDFLAADHDLDPARRVAVERDHADAIKFLLSLRLPGGRFSQAYRCADGRGVGPPSPYADGEVLLALTRAAKAEGADPHLRTVVLESAAVMYGEYVRAALRANPDGEDTKGFYQWGSMAFYELFTSGWPGTQAYAARTIAMARWMTDVHGVTERGRNNGYAFEGLAVAWELARLTGDARNQRHIEANIGRGFSKLLALQIGSPAARPDAVPHSFRRSADVVGGVLTQAADPRLRIDTTQHQMHAAMLIRWLMLREADASDAPGASRR